MTLEFLFLSQNAAFSIALMVVLVLALIEGVGLAFGAGLSDVISSMFPDVEVDIEGPDLDDGGTLGAILAWLRVGQVPIIMLLIILFTSFAVCGLLLQIVIQNMTGWLLPALIASAIAFVAAMPCVRFLGGLMQKYMPQDETYAVSTDSFIGRVASITLGTAYKGHPAEAKLRDEHGKTHYIMVEPEDDGETYKTGDNLLIVRRTDGKFFAILEA